MINVSNQIHQIKHKANFKLTLININNKNHPLLWKYLYFSVGLKNINAIIIDWSRLCKKETSNKIYWWDSQFMIKLFKYCKNTNIKILIVSELKPQLIYSIFKEKIPDIIKLENIFTPYNYYKTFLSQPRRLPIHRISKTPCKIEIDQILDDMVQINQLKINKIIYFGDQNKIIKNTFNIPVLYFDLWKGIYKSINQIINP